jgi:hypothetical protein
MATPGPVTLADLRRQGLALLVSCRCGHRAQPDPDGIRLRPSKPIPRIENEFRFSACGAKNTAIEHPVMEQMDPRPGQRISSD